MAGDTTGLYNFIDLGNPTNSDTSPGTPGGPDTTGSGGGGGSDNRSLFSEITSFSGGRWTYRRVGPAALDWNHAKRDRWNPYLATDKDRQVGETSTKDQDATRVYRRHRPKDADGWMFGSLNDIFLVPCHVHDGGEDDDGNFLRRLEIGIDKAHFYHSDQDHGELSHIGPSGKPPRGAIEVETVLYFHRPTRSWRWKTWVYGGGGAPTPVPTGPGTPTPPSPNPPPPPPGGPVPTPTPGTTPSTPSTPPQPSGGGTQTSGGPADQPGLPGLPEPEPRPEFGGFGIPDFGGGQFTFDPEAQVAEQQMPNRAGAAPLEQFIEDSENELPGVWDGRYTARVKRGERGWHGDTLYETGVDYLPPRPDRGWHGEAPVFTDPGELATFDPTDEDTKTDWEEFNETPPLDQTTYDNTHPVNERKTIYDGVNSLAAAVAELDAARRNPYREDMGTVVILPFTAFTTVTTAFPSIDATPPRIAFGSIGVGSDPFVTAMAQNGDGTWTFDVNQTPAPGPVPVEIDVQASYQVGKTVELPC